MNDYLLDDEYNLQIENGDFKVGESTSQEIQLILKFDKGQNPQFPLVGVGVDRRLKGAFNLTREIKEMRLNLEADNIRVDDIVIEGDANDFYIEIDGQRAK